MNLEAFVEAALHYSLINMGLCTPIEELIDVFATRKPEQTGKYLCSAADNSLEG